MTGAPITRSRNVALLYAAAAIGGLAFYLPTLAVYLERELGGAAMVALIFSVEALGQVALEIPTGALADLFGRRRTLALKQVAQLAALALLLAGGGPVPLLGYAALSSLARSLGSGTDEALLYDSLKEAGAEASYKRAAGIYSALWPLGASLGAISGGYLASASLELAIGASLVPQAIALILFLFLREPARGRAERRSFLRHVGGALRTIARSRQLLVLCAAAFLMTAFGESVHLMSPILFESKALPLESFGWIGAATFGLSSLGFVASHRAASALGDRRALLLATLLSPLVTILATFLAGPLFALAWVSTSLLFGIKNPILSHLTNREVESGERATVISIGNFAGQLGLALAAPAIFGAFGAAAGILASMRLAALLLLSVPALLLFLEKPTSAQ